MDEFNTDRWTTFTNMKATMEFAGQKDNGGAYDKFRPFTSREIEQHIILYSVQGLLPSPQLAKKMKLHNEEPFQGNDLISSIF